MARIDINSCTITGTLGSDPKVIVVGKNNTPKATLNVAVNSRQDRTEWVPVVFWSKTAEFIAEYLSKGDRVVVNGQFCVDSWENNEGDRVYYTYILGDRIVLLGQGTEYTTERSTEEVNLDEEDKEEASDDDGKTESDAAATLDELFPADSE